MQGESIVIFKEVIYSIISSKINIEQYLFGDLVGLSERTVRSIKSNPRLEVPSKRHTQLKNRIDHSIVYSPGNKLLLETIKKFFEVDSKTAELPWVSATKSFEASIASHLKGDQNLPENLLKQLPFQYSLNFLDMVDEPLYKYIKSTDFIGEISQHFPYSVLGDERNRYFHEKYKESRQSIFSDEKISKVVLDSTIAVLAALFLDMQECKKVLLNQDMQSFRKLINEAWGSENPAAYYFKFYRREKGYKTHEDFYSAISKNFPNTDIETVKRNYKRWCQTGKIDRQQWRYFAGGKKELSTAAILAEAEHTIIGLLPEIKALANLNHQKYYSSNFLADLDKWCFEIKKNIKLESWQLL